MNDWQPSDESVRAYTEAQSSLGTGYKVQLLRAAFLADPIFQQGLKVKEWSEKRGLPVDLDALLADFEKRKANAISLAADEMRQMVLKHNAQLKRAEDAEAELAGVKLQMVDMREGLMDGVAVREGLEAQLADLERRARGYLERTERSEIRRAEAEEKIAFLKTKIELINSAHEGELARAQKASVGVQRLVELRAHEVRMEQLEVELVATREVIRRNAALQSDQLGVQVEEWRRRIRELEKKLAEKETLVLGLTESARSWKAVAEKYSREAR
jgi:chromosome segregation ATPase